ncbi:type II toxin-antitoxin system RelE/ParE family toxin [Candidatus Gottesmanbacteria bacterium]|nr:type II toxin-antitoxin system RelE/ParE family toxin [Candidatus Gottesmanbacteria bacterium]
MKVTILPRAEKQLKKLPKIDQIAITHKIRSLKEEKLKGFKDFYRLRVGDYRIVYRRTSEIIYIILIRHRKDVYELLKQLFD